LPIADPTVPGSAVAAGPSLLVIEFGISLIAFSVAMVWPESGGKLFAKAERLSQSLARRPNLAVFAIAAASLLIRLAILPLSPIPKPFIHDEFANLLAADTFASGRLTNPTHPLWVYFESFHITQIPTYMSMYFPAQGLLLAAGKVVAGHAWFGMWLAGGLMCAALCWMLQGWLPPGWALCGGMLAVIRLSLFSYWVDSYYGGAIAAIGGALVLGALPRMIRLAGSLPTTLRPAANPRGWTKSALWMALGVALLANSRPYEGVLLCLPVAYALGRWFVKQSRPPSNVMRGIAPAVLLLIVVAAMDGYYNRRVFGSALTLPYQVNRAEYASAPVFIWQTPRPEPLYRHPVMREFYSKWELGDFLEARTVPGFLRRTAQKAGTVIFFFFGFALLPPLMMLRRVWHDRRTRFLLLAGGVYTLGLGVNVWLFPHYVGPFAGAVYVLLLQMMRHLRVWRPGGRPCGLALVRVIPLVCLALAGLRLFAGPLNIAIPRWPTMWYGTEPLGLRRARVISQLEQYPGPQLAIVRYSSAHAPFDDWVYNAADIDHSKVVWAREMTTGEAGLLQYFHGRTAWLIQPDTDPPQISPWPNPQ